MKKIASFDNYGNACLVVNQLRDLHVNAFDVDQSSHVSIAGAEAYYYIEVPSAEVESSKGSNRNGISAAYNLKRKKK